MIYMDEPKHIRERADAFYLEFSESMKSRLEGGYLLPKQANTVTDYESIFYIRSRNIRCYVIRSYLLRSMILELLEPYLWIQNPFSLITTVLSS